MKRIFSKNYFFFLEAFFFFGAAFLFLGAAFLALAFLTFFAILVSPPEISLK